MKKTILGVLWFLFWLFLAIPAYAADFEADIAADPSFCVNSPSDLGTLPSDGPATGYSVKFCTVDLGLAPEGVYEIIWLGWYDDSRWRPNIATATAFDTNPDVSVEVSTSAIFGPPPASCPACDRDIEVRVFNTVDDPLSLAIASQVTLDFFVPATAPDGGTAPVMAFDESSVCELPVQPGCITDTFVSGSTQTVTSIAVPEPSKLAMLVPGLALLAAGYYFTTRRRGPPGGPA